jgi:hypothetical protein
VFIKYSDKTKPISVDEIEQKCNKCDSNFIIIDSKKTCKCDNDHIYKKSKDFLQKKTNSANSKS